MRPNFGCGIHELVFDRARQHDDCSAFARWSRKRCAAARRASKCSASTSTKTPTIRGQAAGRGRVPRPQDQPDRQPRLSVLLPRGRPAVKPPPAPRLDARRAARVRARSCSTRARAWIPAWGLDDGERDFGRALLEIAARFSSEVAERLDRGGRQDARAAFSTGSPCAARRRGRRACRWRFKLADTAREAVAARASGANAGRCPRHQCRRSKPKTTFASCRGGFELVVGVDADKDAFFLPPPGFSDLEPLEPLPTRWQLKSFAGPGSRRCSSIPARA